ncbi:DUF2829 domain-containing protein [Lactiplantibacillus argentoratensis]|jgi:hypothetical protein|uniref:DUF2829 domain-containing protein n=1 Tax=Lactiplantibacillus argentoratensis TaxID=271881 RepID=A0ABS5UJ12_9LACO|nr:DUF2829 domain-containing protein [Lactiplantibacillus argentoratensis]MBT1141359.1 DUF2829 domain-containing protein [Lactiplantibacillus argentoratensis]
MAKMIRSKYGYEPPEWVQADARLDKWCKDKKRRANKHGAFSLDKNKEEAIMNFGEALEELKRGNCVARKGWNGKGIFIKLKKKETLNTPNNRFNEVMTHDFIYIDTTGLRTNNPNAPMDRVPWLASQTDMLADDWVVVE